MAKGILARAPVRMQIMIARRQRRSRNMISTRVISLSIISLGLLAALFAVTAQAQQVPNPTTAAQVPGPAPGPWTKAYVQLVGRMAYVWGFPLAVYFNQQATHANVTEPMMVNGIVVAPVNQVGMWHDYVDPSERMLGDPNQDVVYGLSYLDLRKEPVIIQVPEFGDRYWVLEVEDARATEFSELGKQYGTKPGFYLIAGPHWKGDTPAGIAGVLRSATHGAISFPRVFMADSPEDRAAIQPLINQIMFYPLSQFDWKMKTTHWSKIPVVKKEVKPAKFSNTQPPWVDPATFFDQLLPKIMKDVPPLPGEENFTSGSTACSTLPPRTRKS